MSLPTTNALVLARAAIHEIAAAVKPGMIEEGAVDCVCSVGTNTIKTFGAPSEPGVVPGDNDIFIIGIGPVFEQWEGDGGDTFVVGDAPDCSRCVENARTLCHRVRRQWLNDRVSGKRL